MRLRIRILEWRMKLGVDPWARAARKRKAKLDFALEQARIKLKATEFELRAAATGEIVVNDVTPDADGGETVFEMPKREAPLPPPSPYKLDETGIEVAVYDPTDSETAALMRRFEMGNVAEHERMAIFGHQVDTEAPPAIEWEGEAPDPFAGIKNLG